ncbi:unnamed protein product [Eruca vesicaria subsp. sativa]|uniref:Uncharacterized protein n=1 Tax=Eruca vesicaria subsp. sativa TaxID=29727 RepID=A0ABC8K4B2_ERUVS|nr:unnamed protein product [Eruca vesicaria subsp. sativa]
MAPSPHRFHLLAITTDLRMSRRWRRPDPSLLSTPSVSYSRGGHGESDMKERRSGGLGR